MYKIGLPRRRQSRDTEWDRRRKALLAEAKTLIRNGERRIAELDRRRLRYVKASSFTGFAPRGRFDDIRSIAPSLGYAGPPGMSTAGESLATQLPGMSTAGQSLATQFPATPPTRTHASLEDEPVEQATPARAPAAAGAYDGPTPKFPTHREYTKTERDVLKLIGIDRYDVAIRFLHPDGEVKDHPGGLAYAERTRAFKEFEEGKRA